MNVPTLNIRLWLERHGQNPTTVWGQNHRHRRAVNRDYVSIYKADELACSLGVHPFEIWGWRWFELKEAA